MSKLFYTIGHSTRSIAELAGLLHVAHVDLIVDVRTIPRSRTNPQFNREILPGALAAYHVGYEHIAELGGRRSSSRDGPSPNTFWVNQSFRNYADYALGEAYRSGLARLRALGSEHSLAIMCAEALWWRCHRRIIADYLLAAGESVLHIMSAERIVPATLTPAARRTPDGTLVYPMPSDRQIPGRL